MAKTAEEIAEYKHQWYLDHKEELLEKSKRYQEKNKDQLSKYKHQYYLDNQEKILEKQKKNYEENRDDILRKQKEYREKNKDKIKECAKQYREENKEKIKEQQKEQREKNKDQIKKKKKEYNNSPTKYDLWAPRLQTYYPEGFIRRDPENPEIFQIKCQLESCNNWVTPTYQQVKSRWDSIRGMNTGDHYIYCSDECKQKCPVFGQMKFPKGQNPNQDYSRDDQPQLRHLVLERDNYTCQRKECGRSLADNPNLKLVCHHKFPLNEDPIGSADIDNCITVCAECHKLIHTTIPGCTYAELRCSDK